MGATVKSTEFVDDNVLFASKQSANSWRLSLTVNSSSETAEGVAKRSKHVADITQVDGTAINTGSSATDQTSVPALGRHGNKHRQQRYRSNVCPCAWWSI
jgi:hypothetical protein